jgi:hypothetical protein
VAVAGERRRDRSAGRAGTDHEHVGRGPAGGHGDGFTNSLAGMADGSVRYGAFVNADGNMIDDGNVYKFADDRYWVLINSAGFEGWFRETAGDLDATITHKTQDLAMIAVQGPTRRRRCRASRAATSASCGTSGSGRSRRSSPACPPRSRGPASAASTGTR